MRKQLIPNCFQHWQPLSCVGINSNSIPALKQTIRSETRSRNPVGIVSRTRGVTSWSFTSSTHTNSHIKECRIYGFRWEHGWEMGSIGVFVWGFVLGQEICYNASMMQWCALWMQMICSSWVQMLSSTHGLVHTLLETNRVALVYIILCSQAGIFLN